MSKKLERALILTGMMNQKFIDMIKADEVDETYVAEAFKNFREAQNPAPKKVEIEYVLGFMFNEDESKVLLIMKNRPAWQAGKLNGVGGKIEAGETPIQAMEREFAEETGFVAKHYIPFSDNADDVDFNAITSSTIDGGIRPDWKLIGTRGRPALFDNQPESYTMHIFACNFNTQIVDIGVAMHDWKDEDGEFFVQCVDREDEGEAIINFPYNLEMIRRNGVRGLAWAVELARCALHENFLLELYDPINMDYIE